MSDQEKDNKNTKDQSKTKQAQKDEQKDKENKKEDSDVLKKDSSSKEEGELKEKDSASAAVFNMSDDDLPESVKEKLEKRKKSKTKQYKKRKRKGEKKKVKVGKAYIKATYNNTIVTLTDLSGNVISWASAGMAGFRGPKKATPYAAQIITKIAVMKAKEDYNLEEVSVFIKGVGTGRESAVRALNANGINITAIKDITPIPHNGCRPRRPRRV